MADGLQAREDSHRGRAEEQHPPTAHIEAHQYGCRAAVDEERVVVDQPAESRGLSPNTRSEASVHVAQYATRAAAASDGPSARMCRIVQRCAAPPGQPGFTDASFRDMPGSDSMWLKGHGVFAPRRSPSGGCRRERVSTGSASIGVTGSPDPGSGSTRPHVREFGRVGRRKPLDSTARKMRQRAALILTILLGAVWAVGPSPGAAQTPPGPPPHVELPDKKPKPEKPEVPNGPKVPSAPEPPEAPEPEPPPPPPPEGEEPPPTDDGGAGTGGGATGGSGAEPRSPAPAAAARDVSPFAPGSTAIRGEVGESQASGRTSRAFGSIASPEAMETASRGSLDGFEASPTSASPTSAASDGGNRTAADEGSLGVGGLPFAILAAGLVLVSIGLAVGVVRARGAGEWRPPGSRPEST